MVPGVVTVDLYNHKVRTIIAAAIAAWCLVSCGQNTNSKEAVRQGVIDHLGARKGLDLDLSSMDVDVTSVTFRANEADAMVSFKPRGSSGAGGMQMKYTLERAGSRWKVKGKAESGNPHGAAPEGGANPHGGGATESRMPSDHPPIPTPKPGSAK